MVTLIAIQESDYPSLYAFMHDTWMDTFSPIIPKTQIEFLLHKYFDAQNIKEFAMQGYNYFYIFDGEKAGLIVYADRGNEIYIDKLYVLADSRGKSYASFAVGEVKKLGKPLALNVNRYNIHAINVYKHLGFTVEKEIDIPLPGGMVNQDYRMVCKNRE